MSDASFALLRDYLKQVETYFKAGIATEHSYRPALQHLLQACTGGISVTNEPRRIKCGAPDYVISRLVGSNALTIGYVEAKDIGVSLDKVEHGEQMGRYLRALDNLVLTDYLEFRWYVKGEKQMTARLATPHAAHAGHAGKSLVLDQAGAQQTTNLLDSFLQHSPEPLRNPAELAKRMARLAHMIRDITVTAFEQREASDTLTGLYEAFKAVLLPDLPPAQFADMFAQTLAYGLFAARYNHKGSALFNRRDAANEIPRTNPFLRKLFTTISGADFEDEPFIGFVNELTQVLGVTDMEAVLADFGKRTRQEDPIVHFYETFLAQYDPKLRELRGVYYTPEPVVSYIVRSVDYLLREQFDCPDGLADTATVTRTFTDASGKTQSERSPRVLILDPACGTGTFSYAIVDLIRETYRQMGNAGMWSSYVREHLLPRLFGFELLMAPYAVAHLKLGMQLAALDLPKAERAAWAYDFASDERLGIFLTNTLEQGLVRSRLLLGSFISDEANEAARVKQETPVMVVIGNPPYSGHSANKGEWITDLLHGDDGRAGTKAGNYFEVDGKPLGERNPKYLNDDYVKFLRFAQWRIEQTGYGILAFITNHGYLDNPTFRGMRQSLMQSFDDIYVLDLHGNSRKKEHSPDGSKDENVFDIQQGVAIGIFVKRQEKGRSSECGTVHHAHLWGLREEYEKANHPQQLVGGKYYWLAAHDLVTTKWAILSPRSPFYLFTPQHQDLQSEYEQNWKVNSIFPLNSTGVKTHRDHFVYDFDFASLQTRIQDFRNLSISDETIAERYKLQDTRDWKLGSRRRSLAANPYWKTFFTWCLYRPFDSRAYFHNEDVVELPRNEVMFHMTMNGNIALVFMRQVALHDDYNHFVATRGLVDNRAFFSNKGTMSLSPLYLYPDPKKDTLFDANEPSTAPGGRRSNLSPAFIADISGKLKMQFVADGRGDLQQTFGPEDVFHYMYAVFHSPTYRTRYAEFLKIDFPRLPLTTNIDLFRSLCKLGERLIGLHLLEQFGRLTLPYPVNGNNIVEKIEYLEPRDQPGKGRVYINKTQYFEGVPSEVWNFHIGGYQVCHKWLKDRKGRTLTFDDLKHYQRIVAALAETIALMDQVDEAIEEHGGWPLA